MSPDGGAQPALFTGRPDVPAWTGEHADQVLPHAGRPRRVLDNGSGPALLFDTGWITHLRAKLSLFSFGEFIERLAQHFTVIRFAKPGCGLSAAGSTDRTFDGHIAAEASCLSGAR